MVIILYVGQLPSGVRVTQVGWCDIRRRSFLPWSIAGFEKAREEGQGNLKPEKQAEEAIIAGRQLALWT